MKNKNLIALFVCIILSTFVNANEPIPNSIQNELKKLSNSDKIVYLDSVANVLKLNNPKLSLSLAHEYLKIAVDMDSDTLRADAIKDIGIAYAVQSDYPGALEKFIESLKIAQENNFYEMQSQLETNIANIYMYQNDFETAEKYHLKALNTARIQKNRKSESLALNNIGTLNANLQKWDIALKYFKESTLIKQELKDTGTVSISLSNIGSIYGRMGLIDSSFVYFNKALKYAQASNDASQEVSALQNIGNCYYFNNDIHKAEEQFEKALKKAENANYNDKEYLILGDLADLNKTTKNYKKTSEYLERQAAVKDTMLNEKNLEQINEMKTRYESELKEKEIEILTKDKKYSNTITKLAIGLFCLALFALFQLLKRYKLRKLLLEKEKSDHQTTKDVSIEEQKQLQSEIDYKNRELSLSVFHNSQKNGILIEIKEKLQLLIQSNDITETRDVRRLDKFIDENLKVDEDWSKFKKHYEEVHPKFFSNLKTQYEGLSQTELKHCAYLSIGLTSKEIARLMHINPSSVHVAHHRIKKKMELATHTKLQDHLQKFS